MAYLAHYKLVMVGALYDSTSYVNQIEESSCSINFASGGTYNPLTDPVPAGLISACQDWWGHADTKISSQARLELVKFNAIGTDGHYVHPYSIDSGPLTTHGGNTSSPSAPPQVSYAVSLRTGLRGPRHRGRFYVPFVHPVMSTGWRMDTSAQLAALATALTLINALNAVDSVLGVIVASGVGGGENNTVTDIRIGDVFDTQRRRRGDLIENYAAADVTP